MRRWGLPGRAGGTWVETADQAARCRWQSLTTIPGVQRSQLCLQKGRSTGKVCQGREASHAEAGGQRSAVNGPSLRSTQTSWMTVQKLFRSKGENPPVGELPSSAPVTDWRQGDQPLTGV